MGVSIRDIMEEEDATRYIKDRERIEQNNAKETFTSKIKRTFGWKRKFILEREREDGSGEVTIELPAKHEGMINSSGKEKIEQGNDENKKDDDLVNDDEVNASYIEVMTTLTTLFTPKYDLTSADTDENKLKFETENTQKVGPEEEKMSVIPVKHAVHHHNPSYTWLSTQSCPPHMDINLDLRQEIMDFEKEYKDVQEIVKKEHIKKSITILLENSKSFE